MAVEWVQRHEAKLRELAASRFVRDFLFEPFRGIFDLTGRPEEREVRSTIAAVALANAVLAGLPGKLGIGVFVAIGLELYMAYRIARHFGYLDVRSPRDAVAMLGAATGALLTVFVLFKEVLGFFFSLFNTVGALPALFLAEYAATTAIGVVLWVGFEAGKERGQFWLPHRLMGRVALTTRDILAQHGRVLRGALSLRNLKLVGNRLRAFFDGELAMDRPALRGDVFVPTAMAFLLAGEAERLDGPMGTMFLDSVRQAWPDLADASIDEMAAFMRSYEPEQLRGVMNLIQGQMFERMAAFEENTDGDGWTAVLHGDRSAAGSDMVLTHAETGERIEVSLKATLDSNYVESALAKYPDIPIVATDEVAQMLDHTGAVQAAGISHGDVLDVSNENFDELLLRLPSHGEAIVGGLTAAALVSVFPFFVAYARGRIGQEQFERALVRVTGETASAVASRLAYAAALGPIFGWYLLARGVLRASRGLEQLDHTPAVRRVEYRAGEGMLPVVAVPVR